IKYMGVEPVKATITLLLWQAEHWSTYQSLVEIVRPKGSKRAPEPVEIVHPLLDMYGLREFYIEKMTLPSFSDGRYEAKLDCIQSFPAPKPSTKPKQETQGSAANVPSISTPKMPGSNAAPGP